MTCSLVSDVANLNLPCAFRRKKIERVHKGKWEGSIEERAAIVRICTLEFFLNMEKSNASQSHHVERCEIKLKWMKERFELLKNGPESFRVKTMVENGVFPEPKKSSKAFHLEPWNPSTRIERR